MFYKNTIYPNKFFFQAFEFIRDWATHTTTLPYSIVTYTSTRIPLLAIPRFETVTS